MQEIKYKVDPNVPGIEKANFSNAGFIIKASQSKTLMPGVSVSIPTGGNLSTTTLHRRTN